MLIRGDARNVPLRDGCVDCVVTSPPYWGLRDYGSADQIGLEVTPDAYVAGLVAVFAEVWRVLREDGTAWVNLGDSYATGAGAVGECPGGGAQGARWRGDVDRVRDDKRGYRGDRLINTNSGTIARTKTVVPMTQPNRMPIAGLKPKDLIGIPWRVAFALQAAGWYLRSDIIWSKPNPMPESVTDRPTKAHEYLFLLAKGQRKSRVVQFSDLNGQRVHLGKYFRLEPSQPDALVFCIRLATAIFDSAQRKNQFSLPAFYSEVWQQSPDGLDSTFVRGLPPDHLAAVWSARFCSAHATAEEFLHQLNGLRVALGDGYHFLIGGISSVGLDAPSVNGDGKATITIHDAGKIGEIQFPHQQIVVHTTTTCNYYYDAAAIRETGAGRDDRGDMNFGARLNSGAPWTGCTYDKPYTGKGTKDYAGAGAQNPSEVKARIVEKILAGELVGRNRRTVWTIPTMPYAGAHFATMPEALVEPCILAGCPLGGLVLDPFCGTFTVGAVAARLGRRAVGVDLSYQGLARERTRQRGLSFGGQRVEADQVRPDVLEDALTDSTVQDSTAHRSACLDPCDEVGSPEVLVRE